MMKNKMIRCKMTFLLLPLMIVAGCGGTDGADVSQKRYEEIPIEQEESPVELESVAEESSQEVINLPEEESVQSETVQEEPESTDVSQISDLTFADLSKYQFEFCSGAGGWSEEFTIEKDGYFTGKYHDSDMGSTGEGYDNGTFYCCTYSGHFTDLVKINEYTYEMKLADIAYDDEVGTEEIIDGVRYIYTDSYCLGDSDTFTVYLPGAPLEELSEDVKMWLYWANESEEELTIVAIADNSNGYGIYSYDRMPALEDAQMTYRAYKESYDYYKELFAGAETTADMVRYTADMYEVADGCLNYIWNLVRYNVSESNYEIILEEQRVWISEKEAAANEASAEYGEGSFAAVSYNDTLATLTMERCEALIEYLK